MISFRMFSKQNKKYQKISNISISKATILQVILQYGKYLFSL